MDPLNLCHTSMLGRPQTAVNILFQRFRPRNLEECSGVVLQILRLLQDNPPPTLPMAVCDSLAFGSKHDSPKMLKVAALLVFSMLEGATTLDVFFRSRKGARSTRCEKKSQDVLIILGKDPGVFGTSPILRKQLKQHCNILLRKHSPQCKPSKADPNLTDPKTGGLPANSFDSSPCFRTPRECPVPPKTTARSLTHYSPEPPCSSCLGSV